MEIFSFGTEVIDKNEWLIKINNLEKRSIVSAISQAHNGAIFSLLTTDKGTLLSGGGKDRLIIEWDLSTKEKSGRNIELTNEYGSCRAITDLDGKLIVGTTNNSILEVDFNLAFYK